MNALDLPRFHAFLLSQMREDDPQAEILRHEMGATLNRNRMTGLQEGIHSFNTDQLCWLLPSNPTWGPDHWMVQSLVLSAVIDDREDIVKAAEDCGLVPPAWTWWPLARHFDGTKFELHALYHTQTEWRLRCALVCLATRAHVELIDAQLLGWFARPDLAKVHHQLLSRGIRGPQGRELAQSALQQLASCPELLFVADVDPTLADLIRVAQPHDPDAVLAPFREAIGDFTKGAIAELELERNDPFAALRRLNGLRQLSVAYPRSVLVAVLAALEAKQFDLVRRHVIHIENPIDRLKISTRLAQADGDASAELAALTELYELVPSDPATFSQLIAALERLGQDDIARHLCFTNQERFLDEPAVMKLISRHTL